MKRVAARVLLMATLAASPAGVWAADTIVVGSKAFTEGYVLGEIAAQAMESASSVAQKRGALDESAESVPSKGECTGAITGVGSASDRNPQGDATPRARVEPHVAVRRHGWLPGLVKGVRRVCTVRLPA